MHYGGKPKRIFSKEDISWLVEQKKSMGIHKLAQEYSKKVHENVGISCIGRLLREVNEGTITATNIQIPEGTATSSAKPSLMEGIKRTLHRILG